MMVDLDHPRKYCRIYLEIRGGGYYFCAKIYKFYEKIYYSVYFRRNDACMRLW